MSFDVLNPEFWRQRIQEQGLLPHRALFEIGLGRWMQIENKHREILRQHIKPDDSILDVGCARGRLLTMLPDDWNGRYVGVDLSPDFINEARDKYPTREFINVDVREWQYEGEPFDWAVFISIRPMILGNCGEEVWDTIESRVRSVARRLLFLEYTPDHQGAIE